MAACWCRFDDDRVRRRWLLNGWLPGLQEAIDERHATMFRELVQMNDDAFHGQGSGVHHVQLRCLR